MPHKSSFSIEEVKQIRNLILQKIGASSNIQQSIRKQIRKIGFYYSDFRTNRTIGGYTVDDFNGLIESGEIVIAE